MKTVKTYMLTLSMAGNIEDAQRYLRRVCYEEGLCVTVTPTTFIYTAGEEEGFVVGFVNYPKYPADPASILARATKIARKLMEMCCQRSALLVDGDSTTWLTVDPPGHREPT